MPFEGGLMCTQRTMQIVLTSCHYFTQRYQPLAWTFFYLMNYSNPVINLYSLLVDTILCDPFTTSAFCMTQTFVPVVRSLLLVIITLSNFSSSFHSVLILSRVTV